MSEITEIGLKELISKLESKPNDLDLINKVAIGFFENPSMVNDHEDLKFFEKAYDLKKTVKSTHNLAWQLYFEWGDETRAFKVQKECIDLKPKSFYPYYQYGFMLLEKNEIEEAIKFLKIAKEKSTFREIEHNIGCCYFKLGEFELAKTCFSSSSKNNDIENRSLYNLALTEFELHNIENAQKISDQLFKTIKPKVHKTIDGHDIGLLYFLLDDLDKTKSCIEIQGIDGIELTEWKVLAYSIYKLDKKLYKNQIQKGIETRMEWIGEIKNNHEDWEDYSEEEKMENLNNYNQEINKIKSTHLDFDKKPSPNLYDEILTEPCGCLMFDCGRHGNKEND